MGWERWGLASLRPTAARETFVTADALSHKRRRFGTAAGVEKARTSPSRVATHLVEESKLLKAQARLGHRDAATTLRR